MAAAVHMSTHLRSRSRSASDPFSDPHHRAPPPPPKSTATAMATTAVHSAAPHNSIVEAVRDTVTVRDTPRNRMGRSHTSIAYVGPSSILLLFITHDHLDPQPLSPPILARLLSPWAAARSRKTPFFKLLLLSTEQKPAESLEPARRAPAMLMSSTEWISQELALVCSFLLTSARRLV